MKVVLLDFCDSLVLGQTADGYVEYAVNSHGGHLRKASLGFLKCLKKHRLFPGRWYKRALLFQLRGITKNELDVYAEGYAEFIMSRIHKPVLDYVLTLKQSGYGVYLVSGGYQIYLEQISKRLGFSGTLGTEIEFNGVVSTGRIAGEDCMGLQKIVRVREHFSTDVKWSDSYAVTDHVSDIPLLMLVGNRLVVDRGQDVRWAELLNIPRIKVQL